MGFEPEPDSFQKACSGIKDRNIDNIELFNYGLWHKKGTLKISQDSLSSSVLRTASQKTVDCDVISLDEFAITKKIDKIDFIKMDIEGAEPEAIIGAEKILLSQKPKLALSAYHRPEHIFELILYLNSLNCGYKFWLGHHRENMWSTILYARA